MTMRARIARIIETVFETALFQSRFMVMLAVLGFLVGSGMMYVKGCIEVVQALGAFFPQLSQLKATPTDDKAVLLSIVPAIDYYLFATVLLMFSMGMYELFISELDPASRGPNTRPLWLYYKSLDDLKLDVGKVVMMLLIVNLFRQAFNISYSSPLDLLYLGGAIVLVALSLMTTHNLRLRRDRDTHATPAPPNFIA